MLTVEREDEEISAELLRAKAEHARNNLRRMKIYNQFANLYPEDFKSPKQEVEQTVTDSQELQLLRQILNPDSILTNLFHLNNKPIELSPSQQQIFDLFFVKQAKRSQIIAPTQCRDGLMQLAWTRYKVTSDQGDSNRAEIGIEADHEEVAGRD